MDLRWHVTADWDQPLRNHEIETPTPLAFQTMQGLFNHIVDDGQELHMDATDAQEELTRFLRTRCKTSFGWVCMDAVLPAVPCILGVQLAWIAPNIYVVDATILPAPYWSLTERQRLLYGLCRYTDSPLVMSQLAEQIGVQLAPKTISNHLRELRRRLGVRADQLAQHAATWGAPIEPALVRKIGHPISEFLQASRASQ